MHLSRFLHTLLLNGLALTLVAQPAQKSPDEFQPHRHRGQFTPQNQLTD